MKILESLKTMAGYVLGGIYLIDIFWVLASLKYKRYEMAAVAAVIAIVPMLWMWLWSRKERRDQISEKRKWRERLVKKGHRIEVDLSKCTISEEAQSVHYNRSDIPSHGLRTRLYRPNSLSELPGVPEQSEHSQRYNAIDERLFPDLAQQEHSYDHCACRITCRVAVGEGKRKRTFHSPLILMDKASLGVKLALRETGYIYFNPSKARDYYFDLEFLRDEAGWSPVEE